MVEGGAWSPAAARAVADLAAASGAEVVVLRVGRGPSGDPVPELEGVLRGRGVERVSVREAPDERDPSRAVLAAAADVAPDLLALCTGARSGLSPWALEGTVERVTRRAPCPVLVLPLGAVPALVDPRSRV